ncbi:MAG: metallophosphoesterase [Bacteroidales bacterium]
MNIIQISDLHIPEEHEFTHNISIRENFNTLLSHIAAYTYDMIVITGDLAYSTGSESIYSYIYSYLKNISAKTCIIAGNHDDKKLLYNTFTYAIPDKKLYYSLTKNNHSFIFLDTSQGYIDKQQLLWLKQTLQTLQNVIIFMHHPPIKSNVEYMDTKYPLQHTAELHKILYAHPYTINVYCGHYHTGKSITSQNLSIHICPSIFYQIDTQSSHFNIEHTNIGFRYITLSNDQPKSEIIWIST